MISSGLPCAGQRAVVKGGIGSFGSCSDGERGGVFWPGKERVNESQQSRGQRESGLVGFPVPTCRTQIPTKRHVGDIFFPVYPSID